MPDEEELYSEIQVLRQEIGSILTDLRILIGNIRKSPDEWQPADVADILEEIANG